MAGKAVTSRSTAARSVTNGQPRETESREAERRARQPLPQGEQNSVGNLPIELPAIDQLQIVNEQGVADPKLDPKLPSKELLRIHRAMVLTRKLDVRMLNMQRQGEMGTFAPGIGQEATQIGQVYPLEQRDWFAPSYRSFGAQMWRGWPIDQLLLLWDGFFAGFAPPEGVNDLPFSIVIGSHLLPAVGVAQGIKYKEKSPYPVLAVNFGDGAMSQGAVNEAFNFAATDKAPIVFVCENNGWAISMPVEKQAATPTLAQRGVGFGIPAVRVDGNDVLAVAVAVGEAVKRARTAGGGPTLIECVTYRMSLHTTADDPKMYRRDSDVEQWNAKCPIARFEKYLIAKGVIDQKGCERVAEECEQEVLAAREVFRKKAIANPREVFDFVYEELTPELKEQQREYFEKLKRKGIE